MVFPLIKKWKEVLANAKRDRQAYSSNMAGYIDRRTILGFEYSKGFFYTKELLAVVDAKILLLKEFIQELEE